MRVEICYLCYFCVFAEPICTICCLVFVMSLGSLCSVHALLIFYSCTWSKTRGCHVLMHSSCCCQYLTLYKLQIIPVFLLLKHNIVHCSICHKNVCSSVCLSHSGVIPKRLTMSDYVLHHPTELCLWFL